MEHNPPNPKPLKGIAMAWPSTDGKAFAIRLQLPDGDLDLELNDTTLKQLLQALLQSSAACAPKRTDLIPITKSELADGVQLPASGIDVVRIETDDESDGDRRRLVMRVGTIDLNLMIGSRTTAKALANALMA